MTKLSGAAHAHSGIDTRSSGPAGTGPVLSLPLFDDRFAPSEDITSRKHGGNPESEAAHEDAKGKRVELHARILSYVAESGPKTCYEISIACGIPYTTASARVSELRRDGRLYPTGRKRRTCTGSFAAVLGVARCE